MPSSTAVEQLPRSTKCTRFAPCLMHVPSDWQWLGQLGKWPGCMAQMNAHSADLKADLAGRCIRLSLPRWLPGCLAHVDKCVVRQSKKVGPFEFTLVVLNFHPQAAPRAGSIGIEFRRVGHECEVSLAPHGSPRWLAMAVILERR